jgi:hypothetical protein
MAMVSSNAFSGDRQVRRVLKGNKKISQQVETVQETLDNQVIGNQETIQQTLDDVIIPMLHAIPCAGTGQDGDFQKGTPWPVPRFADNDDGTVTDNMTGLIWLKNANCFGQKDWTTALTDCNTLNSGECGLADGSDEGDWRLPNISELQSLRTLRYSLPALPNTTGTGQWSEGDPFTGVQSNPHWSSTTYVQNAYRAWNIVMGIGAMYGDNKSYSYYVWPVRDAQ